MTKHRLSILIAKHGVPHRYLSIFLSTDGLSKPSLAKAQSDVKFFSNMVLRKAISNKQFMYLVLAVLQPIVSYHTQFSFVSSAVYFSNEVLYHSLLYGLKIFKQVQAKWKSSSVISFSNSSGIVSQLFEYHFLDLQILGWAPLNPLQFSVRLRVALSNNFLAEIVRIFLINKISMMNNLLNAFLVLANILFELVNILALEETGSQRTCAFLVLLSTLFNNNSLVDVNDVLLLDQFFAVKNNLLEVWSHSISVFTDGFLKEFGSVDVTESAATFFLKIELGIEVRVIGLLFSTIVELQAVALVLECVPSFCSVEVYLDSQVALNACMERRHIANLIVQKDIFVSWLKVKGHFSVLNNICADALVSISAQFSLFLLTNVHEHFLMTNNMLIFGNI
ncbi:hypothetical protein G9A89_007191 [Geosiphon pyriformis]|nr:hypothetical protein G9A89_007191 [Geosiphon pyriformis]